MTPWTNVIAALPRIVFRRMPNRDVPTGDEHVAADPVALIGKLTYGSNVAPASTDRDDVAVDRVAVQVHGHRTRCDDAAPLGVARGCPRQGGGRDGGPRSRAAAAQTAFCRGTLPADGDGAQRERGDERPRCGSTRFPTITPSCSPPRTAAGVTRCRSSQRSPSPDRSASRSAAPQSDRPPQSQRRRPSRRPRATRSESSASSCLSSFVADTKEIRRPPAASCALA